MKSHSQEFIAGWKTAADWKLTRSILVSTTDPAIWGAAFDDYFETRMELRYLNPIRVLQENGTFQGEGFSIAAIQCSIIQFLESTWQGLSYKYRNPGAFEYAESGKIFKDFLTKRDPFKTEFTDDIATDFYVGVRCGLLHEAEQKMAG